MLRPANQREQTFFIIAQMSEARLQVVEDIHVGDDGVMGHALKTFIVEMAGFTAPDYRSTNLDVGKTTQPDQCADNRWNIADLVLGKVSGLRPRIGDQLLTVAVVKLLCDRQRFVGVPSPALTAGLLQGG